MGRARVVKLTAEYEKRLTIHDELSGFPAPLEHRDGRGGRGGAGQRSGREEQRNEEIFHGETGVVGS